MPSVSAMTSTIRNRWTAEAAISWLHGPRRLCIRRETRDDIHNGFLQPDPPTP